MSTPWPKIPPARRGLLEQLAREFAHNYAKGRTALAVDGPDGAGKSRFADDLATALRRDGLEVFRASLDDFHHPREHRHRAGRHSPEGYYRDAFDVALFRRVLLEPFRLGGSTGFQLRGFDLARDVPVESEWATGPADAVLVVDGLFLQRPELRGAWSWSVWLDADAAVRLARRVERDRADPDPDAASNRRYADALRRYVAETHPNAAADAIVDNTDPEHPRRRYADYCSIVPAPM